MSKIEKDIPKYKRINWQDGITPLNDDNLNILDEALFCLLEENGFIPELVSTLNDEIDARTTDVKKLETSIDNIDTSVQQELENINNELNNKVDSAVIEYSSDKQSEGVYKDGTTLHIVVDAYKKSETYNKSEIEQFVDEKLSEFVPEDDPDDSSVSEVKQDLEEYKSTTDNTINQLTNKITSIENNLNDIPDDILTESDKFILNCGSSTTVLF